MRSTEMKLLYLIIGLFFATNLEPSSFRTTLNNADPNPFYSSKFPFEPLFDWTKDYLNNRTCQWENQYAYVSASAFFQQANKGNNQDGKSVELSDLTGKWNMIAILPYNATPGGNYEEWLQQCFTSTDVPTNSCQCVDVTTLVDIRNNLLACIQEVFGSSDYPTELKSVQGLLQLQNLVELLGFMSVPIHYKRKGVRFQVGAMLAKGLGVSFDIGVSNITQTTGKYIDYTSSTTCLGPETCISSCPSSTKVLINCLNPFAKEKVTEGQWGRVVACVHNQLMNNIKVLAKAMNISLCDYNKTSLEDIHAELFWRNAFCENTGRSNSWPKFLFIPFFHLGVTWGTGKQQNPDQIFSVASGNNGHNEVDFLAGFGLDFQDSIEVGAEAGLTHFSCLQYDCYRMPNNIFQNGVYPYQTAVVVKPGDTWHIGAFMNARYFIDHWSFWLQYVYINHNKDKICLVQPDVAYHPDLLECRSAWTVQLFNAGLNYDISPNFSLGVFVQIPLARENAYRDSTGLGNFTITF